MCWQSVRTPIRERRGGAGGGGGGGGGGWSRGRTGGGRGGVDVSRGGGNQREYQYKSAEVVELKVEVESVGVQVVVL